MTTIAYRDGVMAGDSCWSDGGKEEDQYAGLIINSQNKLRRLKSGALYGGSGAPDDRELVERLDKVCHYSQLPSSKELMGIEHSSVLALLALPDGTVWRIYTGEVTGGAEPIHLPFAAVGSGAQLAIGAMAVGAGPIAAVEVACKHSVYSRPPVHYLNATFGGHTFDGSTH